MTSKYKITELKYILPGNENDKLNVWYFSTKT